MLGITIIGINENRKGNIFKELSLAIEAEINEAVVSHFVVWNVSMLTNFQASLEQNSTETMLTVVFQGVPTHTEEMMSIKKVPVDIVRLSIAKACLHAISTKMPWITIMTYSFNDAPLFVMRR